MGEVDRERIAREIADLVRKVPKELIQGFADLLEVRTSALPDLRSGPLARIFGMIGSDAGLRDSVVLAFRAAALAVADERSEETVELVWTGPAGGALRRIDQALDELVESARESLLLATFAAGRVPALAEALTRAVARGVDLVFLGESEERDGTCGPGDAERALGPALASRARVFTWPLAGRPAGASLHAKCAVADDRALLISSANLTGAALGLNMELGLFVRGGPHPRSVKAHFRSLMDAGILVPAPH